jgi:hypothetical protein
MKLHKDFAGQQLFDTDQLSFHSPRLVAGRREKAGDQQVGVDNRPGHLALRPADSFSCRCATISMLICAS